MPAMTEADAKVGQILTPKQQFEEGMREIASLRRRANELEKRMIAEREEQMRELKQQLAVLQGMDGKVEYLQQNMEHPNQPTWSSRP